MPPNLRNPADQVCSALGCDLRAKSTGLSTRFSADLNERNNLAPKRLADRHQGPGLERLQPGSDKGTSFCPTRSPGRRRGPAPGPSFCRALAHPEWGPFLDYSGRTTTEYSLCRFPGPLRTESGDQNEADIQHRTQRIYHHPAPTQQYGSCVICVAYDLLR